MHVHQPPSTRAELGVEATADAKHRIALAAAARQQALLGRQELVGPRDDLLGLADHALRRDEHGHRAPAPRTARRQAVHALHVALLAIAEAGALERPARLLAVVADRDRDEPQHAGERQ